MPLLDLLLAMFWFFLFFMWIYLVIMVFIDIFRSHDLSGWAKAGWIILIIILPLFGVLIYVIVRGRSMGERSAEQAVQSKRATDDYIRTVAGSGDSTSDEIAKLAALRDNGTITDDEFQAQKAKLLS